MTDPIKSAGTFTTVKRDLHRVQNSPYVPKFRCLWCIFECYTKDILQRSLEIATQLISDKRIYSFGLITTLLIQTAI
jgi:hypothetical protein